MKSREKLYEFHVANLKEIDNAQKRVALSLRASIASSKPDTYSFKCLYALLLGAWAEVRLQKLLYETQGFSLSEIEIVKAESSQLKKWEKATELAFRKQYGVPKARLTPSTLPHSAHSRYMTLSEMLKNDLVTVIELRNKLAHGQWIYPLNDAGTDVVTPQKLALINENLLGLQFKKTLLEILSSIIHDLVVSRTTFERDFDKQFNKIVQTRRNLRTRDYEKYEQDLREKYQRGKVKKSNTTNS